MQDESGHGDAIGGCNLGAISVRVFFVSATHVLAYKGRP